MTSSNLKKQNLFSYLPILGIFLLVFGFFLLVPDQKRNATALLDLAVVCVIFILHFILIPNWRQSAIGFDSQISKLSVLWPLSFIITALSIALVVVGWAQGISFNIQLVAQLFLGFGMLLGASAAFYTSNQIEKIALDESQTMKSLQALKDTIRGCERTMENLGHEWNQERESFSRLKENARYLSPSIAPEAISHEDQLRIEIMRLIDIIQMPAQPEAKRIQVREHLEKCSSLMSFRKQF